jgi:murein DD-endopeptidase MepM/ murein hydrolase activator NlpD
MNPLLDYRITQEYGTKDSRYRKGYHTGIDLVSSNQSVFSAVSGSVVESRYAGGRGADPSGWGNYVIVRTNDGYDTLYAHLSEVNAVKGDSIQAGSVLGKVGSTGNSTGPHLHFEVWQGSWIDRKDVDPLAFLNSLGGVIPVSQLTGNDNPVLSLPFWNPATMNNDELLKFATIGALAVALVKVATD